MSENADSEHRAMSLHLARVLDEIGLNTQTVKKRRHTILNQEQMQNVFYRHFKDIHVTSYHFGSQTEGTTTPGLDSDLDTLVCNNDCNAIDDLADWKQGMLNVLMRQEDTAPGYCRLQVLSADEPVDREDLPSEDFVYDDRNRILMPNGCFHPLAHYEHLTRSGPAASGQQGSLFPDYDFVYAMRCSKWPKQAEEFIRRRRHHDWPSQRLIEEATSHGVFLVPVGHKLSPTEPLEWRISASLAERHLMFSLSIVHIKCYVVLKFLIKSFVAPRVEKCISSYHCKTAMLFCTENTESGFWREDNLVHCVLKCLEMLRDWVTDLFCPQFIISKENLFTGKVTAENRDMVLPILNEMIESDGRILLRVAIDELGQKLQSRIDTKPSCVPILDSFECVELVGVLEDGLQLELHANILKFILDQDDNDSKLSAMREVYQHINKLCGLIDGSNKHERYAINSFITILSCWLGSMLASFALAHKARVPSKAIRLIHTAAKNDVSSMLKLAFVYYCNGKKEKAEITLKTIEDMFCRKPIQAICMCYDNKPTSQPEVCRVVHLLSGTHKNACRSYAHCVRYSRHEIHCVPPALRHELQRAVCDLIICRDPVHDKWMVLAVVDCLPYLYYLQYITYGQLGKEDLQHRSLRNLERCARDDETLRHRETAWNLLGQCWESEQKPDTALACYRSSLEIRPRNNAAKRHMQCLSNKETVTVIYQRQK